jgi:lipopolysaccharide export system ATP-binding protein
MIRNKVPLRWTADVLDAFLAFFRGRGSAGRRRMASGADGWRGINLKTLGGWIGLGRSDQIPRIGPLMRPHRSYAETDDWQPAPSYAPQPAQVASPQPGRGAGWQEARYDDQQAEPPGPQYARHSDVTTAPTPEPEPYRPPQPDETDERNFLAAYAVEKSFGDRKVVKGASLYVRRGEAVGLLGPNGAGKTTIFYMMTGLIAADRGHVELDGHDVTTLPMYQRARLGIGYLPQEASIFRGLTVEENIRAVLEVVEPNKKRRERDLDALLDEFNIARLRKSPSIALSGGERRRCEIARALASRPNYMLLDEPFAGIDPIAVGDIQQLVRHLTNRGIGVLITDHNVRETLGLTDRAYIIYSGEVLMEGRADDIVNNPDVRRLYLGEDFSL